MSDRMPACGDMNCHNGRERKMVWACETAFCDPCLASIIKALNDGGLETIASCCGHGFRPASVILRDGREIIIARDREEGRLIETLFPLDINGNHLRDSGSDRNGEDAAQTAAECEAAQSGPKGIAHPHSGPSHDK